MFELKKSGFTTNRKTSCSKIPPLLWHDVSLIICLTRLEQCHGTIRMCGFKKKSFMLSAVARLVASVFHAFCWEIIANASKWDTNSWIQRVWEYLSNVRTQPNIFVKIYSKGSKHSSTLQQMTLRIKLIENEITKNAGLHL